MSNHPNNPYFNLENALRYLDFAIQFTPQYGDSFLEMIKVCHLLQLSGVDASSTLEKTKQSCLHSEPNYGVLWFFFKNSLVDSACDIWNEAETAIAKETSGKQTSDIHCMGSKRLSVIIKGGMKIGSGHG
jgi:hypothetical protein